jgi:hypothetical protein
VEQNVDRRFGGDRVEVPDDGGGRDGGVDAEPDDSPGVVDIESLVARGEHELAVRTPGMFEVGEDRTELSQDRRRRRDAYRGAEHVDREAAHVVRVVLGDGAVKAQRAPPPTVAITTATSATAGPSAIAVAASPRPTSTA